MALVGVGSRQAVLGVGGDGMQDSLAARTSANVGGDPVGFVADVRLASYLWWLSNRWLASQS